MRLRHSDMAGMRLRRGIARICWAASRYRLVGRALPAESGIVIGAPHTSNWDFAAFVGVSWYYRVPLKVLVKQSWMRGPVGAGLRLLGGLPVDRENPSGVVDELVARARAGERFQLVLAPKGTRSPRPYWKSGFYRMATQAGLPLTLAGIDHDRREVEIGPTLHLSGDVRADMDRIRAFYARFGGIDPTNRSEPRLRQEGFIAP